MKQRLYVSLFALVCAVATLYNWHLLRSESGYYPKLAVFAPSGVVFFGAVGLFPKLAGMVTPEQKTKKYAQAAVLLLALAAGLLNWYAMANS